MNILSKKKWNVWNRDNIERVLKDEAAAREEEKAAEAREREAASAKRLHELRRRARGGSSGAGASEAEETGEARAGDAGRMPDAPRRGGHINLFSAEEARGQGNPDTRRDRRKEKEKELRKAGLAPSALGGRLAGMSAEQRKVGAGARARARARSPHADASAPGVVRAHGRRVRRAA